MSIESLTAVGFELERGLGLPVQGPPRMEEVVDWGIDPVPAAPVYAPGAGQPPPPAVPVGAVPGFLPPQPAQPAERRSRALANQEYGATLFEFGGDRARTWNNVTVIPHGNYEYELRGIYDDGQQWTFWLNDRRRENAPGVNAHVQHRNGYLFGKLSNRRADARRGGTRQTRRRPRSTK